MNAVDPLDAFLGEGADEPVLMINLMRFRPDGGRERFARYMAAAAPLVRRHGGEFVHEGPAGPPVGGDAALAWDHVVLVRYAHRRQFAALMRDPEYTAVNALRLAAVSEAVVQPLH